MNHAPVAVITGASRGFGLALARSLSDRGWRLVVDARGVDRLTEVAASLPDAAAIPGDITDSAHRDTLTAAVRALGRLDLMINNASELGPSPLPRLAEHPIDALRGVYEANVIAPLALIQDLLPLLRANAGTVVNISSDAAVEVYETWGGYGSSKAALDQLSAVLAAEEPQLRVYALDPGDMRTDMHQRAYPTEDISDRPLPEVVVPGFLRLLDDRPASGRYRIQEWIVAGAVR